MQLSGLPGVVGYTVGLFLKTLPACSRLLYNQSVMVNHMVYPCRYSGSINVEEALWPKGRCAVLHI